jgi:hypothetical protein
MFTKYQNCTDDHGIAASRVLNDWADNHKTAIFLNGGNAASVRAVYDQLWGFGHTLSLPFDLFHEDQESLGGTMTACGIIVPTLVVDIAQLVPPASRYQDMTTNQVVEEVRSTCFCLGSDDEIKLAMFLNNFSLAR